MQKSDILKNITRKLLRPIVCEALADPTAMPTTWEITSIHGGTGSMVGGTALYRIVGQTATIHRWSIVLKVLYARPDEAVDSPYYWKREYEFYRSAEFTALPQRDLTPPHIYGCTEFSDSCWIWMEDIPAGKLNWDLADYALVARRLGRFNGAYLTGHPMPDAAWLTDQWHCRIVPPLADVFDNLDEHLQEPLVQRVLPLSKRDAILAIWQERQRYCETLASLPQTFCHLDVFPQNIFHNESRTTLIDWALCGRGAVGEELVCFVALALYAPQLSLSQADTLDQTIFEGYIKGLRDVGWTGDAQLVRLGYTCAMTLRGLAGVKQDITMIQKKAQQVWQDGQRFNAIEDLADFWANIRRFRLLQMAEETRSLFVNQL
ncbi:MAG: phosphotransferase [Chloroflexota bacterium]